MKTKLYAILFAVLIFTAAPHGLLLDVSGMGSEVQLAPKETSTLTPTGG